MVRLAFTLSLAAAVLMLSPQEHDHPAPEKLGTVSFQTSCKPEVQRHFERAVALLHSFSYKAADEAFQQVAQQDPGCAIAHWGSAMTHYHQLWDLPPSPRDTAAAVQELELADKADRASERERGFIRAARLVFQDAATVPYGTRALNYKGAMRQLAAAYPKASSDPGTDRSSAPAVRRAVACARQCRRGAEGIPNGGCGHTWT